MSALGAQHLYTEVADELILVTTDRYTSFTYGEVIRVEGELQKPESFTTDLGRTFNYPGYLKAQGVEYLVRGGEVAVIDEGEGVAVLGWPADV